MLKLKLNEVVSSVEGLKALLEVKLPFKISYRISKLVTKVERELKVYDEARTKLIMDLGEKNEEGNMQVKDEAKLEEFKVKLQEILDHEIEIDFDPINAADLGDISLEPRHVVAWIFA